MERWEPAGRSSRHPGCYLRGIVRDRDYYTVYHSLMCKCVHRPHSQSKIDGFISRQTDIPLHDFVQAVLFRDENRVHVEFGRDLATFPLVVLWRSVDSDSTSAPGKRLGPI